MNDDWEYIVNLSGMAEWMRKRKQRKKRKQI